MDETRKEELRRQLEKEREEIRTTMEMPGQEKFADDLDNADQGSLAVQYSAMESASIVRARLEDRLNAIDAALQAIQSGTYGQCENCGRAIAPERLDANPASRLCADCAA